MEFFDKLGKKASDTYKYTTEKTSKLAKEAKLKMAMNEKKSKIEELYEEIGRKCYENHIKDDDVDMDLEAILEEDFIKIDVLCDEIEEERKELLTLKDRKQCPECFYEIDLEYNYCPNCGYKQEDSYNNEEHTVNEDEEIKFSNEE